MPSAWTVAGARHFSQLVSWQLADALRVETFKLTRRLPFARDFKHQAQAEDAVDSVCRNIAEGFGCTSHAEFARFLEISRRSLNELLDTFRSARLKGYVSADDVVPIHELARRLYPALNRFIAYLRQNPNRTHRTDKPRPRTDHNLNRTNQHHGRTNQHHGRTDQNHGRTDNNQNRTDPHRDRTDNRQRRTDKDPPRTEDR